jgi:predicted NUDIX family phosphoesterase
LAVCGWPVRCGHKKTITMSEERVLCFERKLLDGLGLFQGLSFETDRYFAAVTSPASLTYLVRREAEQDKRFKQLIPYVLLVSGSRVLHYQRGKGGGETRLHGLYSIGVGGHISDQDQDLFSKDLIGYYDGMWRELREEVDIEPLSEAAVAVINDDSTEVGMVHFGVVHVVRVEEESAVGRRKGIVSPEFVSISDAVRTAQNYESWSRLCLENIELLLRKAKETARPLPPGGRFEE